MSSPSSTSPPLPSISRNITNINHQPGEHKHTPSTSESLPGEVVTRQHTQSQPPHRHTQSTSEAFRRVDTAPIVMTSASPSQGSSANVSDITELPTIPTHIPHYQRTTTPPAPTTHTVIPTKPTGNSTPSATRRNSTQADPGPIDMSLEARRWSKRMEVVGNTSEKQSHHGPHVGNDSRTSSLRKIHPTTDHSPDERRRSITWSGNVKDKETHTSPTAHLAVAARKNSQSHHVEVTDWRPFSHQKKQEMMADLPQVVGGPNPITSDGSTKTLHNSPLDTPLKRSYTSRDIRPRTQPMARRIYSIMASPHYLVINVILTVFSLYAHDFTLAVLPMSVDHGIGIALCVIFALFAIELIVNIFVKHNYLLSFTFCMDVIGTFSLIFDIPFIMEAIWPDVTGLDTTHHGANDRVARSASALRIAKFARVLRVVRLIRVVRIFKFQATFKSQKAHPSKVGLHLAELIDKRVIIMLLTLLFVLPLLELDMRNPGISEAMGLELLEDVPDIEKPLIASKFIVYHYPNVIYLASKSWSDGTMVVYQDARAQYGDMRIVEKDTYTTKNSTAMLDVSHDAHTEAKYMMITTSLIIVMFGVGSFLVSRDVHSLVVAPLDRMTQVIRRLAGTICLLSNSNDADETQQQLEENYETTVIETIIERMAAIFSVKPDHSGTMSKAMQMMSGSKHTEIRTVNSVVSIEVVERPRAPQVDFSSLMSNGQPHIDVDLDLYPELSSIESILTNPQTLPHFKLYMTSNLLIENLLFWQEVDRYRSIVKLHALRLYNSFISPKASSAINVPASQRDAVRSQLDDPSASMFDASQREILMLMRGNCFNNFLRSKFCQGYLRNRPIKPLPPPSHRKGPDPNSTPTLLMRKNSQQVHNEKAAMEAYEKKYAVNKEKEKEDDHHEIRIKPKQKGAWNVTGTVALAPPTGLTPTTTNDQTPPSPSSVPLLHPKSVETTPVEDTRTSPPSSPHLQLLGRGPRSSSLSDLNIQPIQRASDVGLDDGMELASLITSTPGTVEDGAIHIPRTSNSSNSTDPHLITPTTNSHVRLTPLSPSPIHHPPSPEEEAKREAELLSISMLEATQDFQKATETEMEMASILNSLLSKGDDVTRVVTPNPAPRSLPNM